MKGTQCCVYKMEFFPNCGKRGFCCEFYCYVGEGKISEGVLSEEEVLLGPGGRDELVKLVKDGWIPKKLGKFVRLEKGADVLVSNNKGGFYFSL